MGLLTTFILGLFIIIGAMIVFIFKNNKRFINFSISLAFVVIIMLILVDLVPEVYEIFTENYDYKISIIAILLTIVAGMTVLKLLDIFIPDHDHSCHDKDCHDNLIHIGVISSIALILHNIVEGMAVYTATETSFKTGALIAIGVGLHNIPLGMIITSSLYDNNKSKKRTLIIVSLIALSTFVGGLMMAFIGSHISELVEGIILGVTLGMLLYIAFFELLPKVLEIKKEKETIMGIVIGIVIIVTVIFLGHHH